MNEQYRVRIDKDEFVFSAGHFITYGDNVCERLHGHNYRVAIEVRGSLNEHQYVVDFVALCESLREIVRELDHRMLLPIRHPLIRITTNEREVVATFDDRRWVFPRGDCVLLDVVNTTTEMLARHIGHRLLAELRDRLDYQPERLLVEVDENHGLSGACELTSE